MYFQIIEEIKFFDEPLFYQDIAFLITTHVKFNIHIS